MQETVYQKKKPKIRQAKRPPHNSSETSMAVPVPVLILLSIMGSTTLILTNKQIMSIYGFGFPTFLTAYHFILTYSLLNIMGAMGLFQRTKNVPQVSAWSIAFWGVLSLVAMNFNLKVNSIGFYQISKLCNIPCMVIYKYFFLKQTTPFNTLGALAILLVGLSIFSVNDVQFSILGTIIAAVAVVSTTIYQTQTQTMQKQFGVSGVQLNHAIGIQRFVMGIIAAFAIEAHGNNNIFNHDFKQKEVLMILGTGFLALMGNVVGFSLIGKAGPITFQVVGHVKTMLIFIIGLILFPSKQESHEQFVKKIIGLCISMFGVILYTIFEISNKKKLSANQVHLPQNEPSYPVTQNKDIIFEKAKEDEQINDEGNVDENEEK